jgi:hypothetical protein
VSMEPVKVWPEKLIGAKYVRLLEKQLRNLQDEDAHGNRRLFLDDVFVVLGVGGSSSCVAWPHSAVPNGTR